MYSFKCGEEINNKMKGVSKSQSKHIIFEDYKKCSDGEEYHRESKKYILRSISLEMYLQETKKSTLSLFDDQRKYLSNIESLPWN